MTATFDLDATAMRARGRALLDGDVIWFPVRHHSPACARHVRDLILERVPWAVLVEGPPSFNDVIDHIVHPDAAMPLAIHAHVVVADAGAPGGERRHASYYPLCDYSPELAALRAGAAVGSRLGFVDLDVSERALIGAIDDRVPLNEEAVYAFSTTLAAVATELGCRDHNELWDHMIEAADLGRDGLVEAVAAYGALARLGAERDGHRGLDVDRHREAAMVNLVRDCVAARDAAGSSQPIVVVTGASHTAVLPDRYASRPVNPPPARPVASSVRKSGHGLVRFSFDRLDALSGYAAGMPAPAWYQDLWDAADAEAPEAEAAHRTLSDIAATLRAAGRDGQPATPSLIDAHVQVELLSRLRGRHRVARCDVTDAALTCFAKGEHGLDVVAAVRHRMTGSRVGRLPAGTPRAPIAVDFDRRTAALRLRVDTSELRRVELAIYRSERDRNVSRFLHAATVLDVPFGHPVQLPRWSAAAGRDVVREIWACRLTAETDVTLAEASMWGSSIDEAATARLQHRFHELLATQPSSADLLRLVMTVAQCGVHDAIGPILAALRERVGQDPSLTAVAVALVEADLLWSARRPLDGAVLSGLPAIGEQLFLRACRLIPDLDTAPVDALDQHVTDLRNVRHIAATADWLSLDQSLMWDALDRLRRATRRPRLHGAIDGLRWSAGLADEAETIVAVRGHLAADDAGTGAEYLAGLVTVAREALWHLDGVLTAISEQLASIEDTQFVRRLPGLRAVFATLAPRETDRLAERLAEHRISRAAPHVRGVGERELMANVSESAVVTARLRDDGLAHWLEPEPPTEPAGD